MKKITPFLKWVGGKARLLDEIKANLPEMTRIKTYIEPFVGGGSVFITLMQEYDLERVIINDMNTGLTNTYTQIRDNFEEVVDKLSDIQKIYNSNVSVDYKKEYYYSIRNLYNTEPKDSPDSAAFFIFLNKTCFNGLYRENKKGEFNTSFGNKKVLKCFDYDNLKGVSGLLNKRNKYGEKTVSIINKPYHESLREGGVKGVKWSETLIYFDPPYRPITKNGFNSYNKSPFSDCDQVGLANVCNNLDKIGGNIMVSNSDPRIQVDGDEPEFFDTIYKEFEILRVPIKRNISCKSSTRKTITELLIHNNRKHT
jgi:DNA adenine methylase